MTTGQAWLIELHALINTPRTDDFFEAVRIEAAHQIERWGVEHDAGKRAEDWVSLLTRLLGKVVDAHWSGDRDKLLHHVITLAAVALNWHRNLTGVSTAMRPGVAPSAIVCGRPEAERCGWHGTAEELSDEDGCTYCPRCGYATSAPGDLKR